MTNLGRVAIYVRCSTSEQSTDMQKTAIADYLAKRLFASTKIYDDAGHSGTSTTRPGMIQLMKDIRANKIDTVICYKLDRWFRSLKEIVNTLQYLSESGVAFVATHSNVDATTSEGRLMMHMLAAFAEFERELIVDRVKAGLKNARAKGKVFGRQKAQFDEAEARKLRAEGMSWDCLAKHFGLGAMTVYRRLNPKTDPNSP